MLGLTDELAALAALLHASRGAQRAGEVGRVARRLRLVVDDGVVQALGEIVAHAERRGGLVERGAEVPIVAAEGDQAVGQVGQVRRVAHRPPGRHAVLGRHAPQPRFPPARQVVDDAGQQPGIVDVGPRVERVGRDVQCGRNLRVIRDVAVQDVPRRRQQRVDDRLVTRLALLALLRPPVTAPPPIAIAVLPERGRAVGDTVLVRVVAGILVVVVLVVVELVFVVRVILIVRVPEASLAG